MAAGVTSIGQVMQAKDAAGTDAEVVTNNAATITANTKVAAATLTVDTVVATNKVTVGLTFEAAAAADLANRKFAVGAMMLVVQQAWQPLLTMRPQACPVLPLPLLKQ